MKKIAAIALVATLPIFSIAQTKIETINVKASIYCDHCKKCESCGARLEKAIFSEKGVKRFDIDEKEKTITVVYNSSKTTAQRIRYAIARAGYDADGIKGDAYAYSRWDDCCKKK